MLTVAAVIATGWGGVEVARSYGLVPAAVFGVSGVAGALLFPIPTVVGAAGFAAFLRIKPLLGKW